MLINDRDIRIDHGEGFRGTIPLFSHPRLTRISPDTGHVGRCEPWQTGTAAPETFMREWAREPEVGAEVTESVASHDLVVESLVGWSRGTLERCSSVSATSVSRLLSLAVNTAAVAGGQCWSCVASTIPAR
jgi:hypothetical protein